MKTGSAFVQPFEKLPSTLPVFPLARAVVLPGGELPLNIFEPRYLNMVQDAMSSHRLIGMIQPSDEQKVPRLYPVGCAGRITRYAETSDARLEIVLSGVCRFRIIDELSTLRGYRLVRPGWNEFAADYCRGDVSAAEVAAFHQALKTYFQQQDLRPDWDRLCSFGIEELTSNLLAALPLGAAEKQLLLEANNLSERLEVFAGVLRTQSPEGGGAGH